MNGNTLKIVELIVLTISALLVIWQIILLRKQIRTQHEEHRRENTTNIMFMWCNSLQKETCMAEVIARNLNTSQCKKLYLHEPFSVDATIKNDICKFCACKSNACMNCGLLNDGLIVDGKILSELRWHVITYLNTLETVLAAWHLGTVDRATIQEQFAFLTNPDKGNALVVFRCTAGGYPLIEEFIDTIKAKGNTSSKRPL